MTTDRLITVAIHTFERASALKTLLEHEGVSVTLQNVNLENPIISSGVRVRIHESNLPLALRIIENPEIFRKASDEASNTKMVLVPVDFSEYSTKACRIAFNFAHVHKATIVLLHTYISPGHAMRSQLSDSLSFDANKDDIDDLLMERDAEDQMAEFSSRIIEGIKKGEIPPVKFTHVVSEGVPEDVINQYAKEHNPQIIVMGTRGAGTKERELVGSVTAEVLDTCRFPVFTVPESVSFTNCNDIERVIFFSNFDQEDILALDALFQLMPTTKLNVKLVRIPSKKNNGSTHNSLDALLEYCKSHYTSHSFTIDTLLLSNIEDDFHRITAGDSVDLIAVPNKKKNIFARLFNPGIAHRLLFHTDIPMMVVPV